MASEHGKAQTCKRRMGDRPQRELGVAEVDQLWHSTEQSYIRLQLQPLHLLRQPFALKKAKKVLIKASGANRPGHSKSVIS